MGELSFNSEQPWLAPLAGWSDLAFRLLCREYGAAVCCTEMISAKGLIYNQPGTNEMLTTIEADNPLVVQLFGEDSQVMYQAVQILIKRGFRYFDCNMGCSVPKVLKTGAGAALLKDHNQAMAIVNAMLKAGADSGEKTKFGFKLRLGFGAEQDKMYQDLGQAMAAQGASWLTLHPRTARQGFSGSADWEQVSELVKLVKVPVIASGDLWTAEDGLKCLAQTCAATVMYARGALRNPRIFSQHRQLVLGQPVVEEFREDLYACIKRHAELAKAWCVPKVALLKMRTSIPRYVRNYEGVNSLRQAIIQCRDWDEFDKIIKNFFEV